MVCDITKEEDCNKVLSEGLKKFGRFDVLINNARNLLSDDHIEFWKARPQFWEQSIRVNVYGTFLMSRAVAPHLMKNGWGRIVNVSTGVDTMQRRLNAPYGVTKAAIDAETAIWSKELTGTGVTVNTILPGGSCETGVRKRPPLSGKKLLSAEVMVPPAVWLSSDLSDGHTGERYVGRLWDTSLPPAEAAKKAQEPSAIRSDPNGM